MSTVSRRTNFSSHPLVALAAALAAGVMIARLAPQPPAPCVVIAALASASAFAAALKKRHALAVRLVVLAFACAGAALASVEAKENKDESRLRSFYQGGNLAPGEPVELTGVLERAPEIAPDGLVLALRVEGLRYKTEEHVCAGRVELFGSTREEIGRASCRERV